ncbi:MAG: hypothetical protein AB9842_01420 [Bacteroidales bacterium]
MSDWIKSFYSYWDIILVPLYLVVIFFIAYWYARSKTEQDILYKYFLPGLMVKILGGLTFTAVYTLYYKGGDCHAYFWNSKTLVNLLFKSPEPFFSILAGYTTPENRSFFDDTTGFPTETMYQKGGENFAVARFMVPFTLLGFNDMLVATVLMNVFAFWGIWQFYKMLATMFPEMRKYIAIAVLFIPSVLFWGSGIMKDAFCLTAALWAAKNIFSIFIMKRKIPGNILVLGMNIFTLISMKPYVVVALIPCLALAVSHQWTRKIKNRVISAIIGPALITTGLFAGIFFLSLFKSSMGTYSSLEGAISKAQINQQDLIRSEQYGTHGFDIGEFDASLGSMLFKAPNAIIAGIFRPYLWEAGNVVMLISGLENTILLFITLFILFKAGLRRVFAAVATESYVLFAITFSLLFAFSVGLSTANFGALARYKIPAIPFFVTALAVIWGLIQKKKQQELQDYNPDLLKPSITVK